MKGYNAQADLVGDELMKVIASFVEARSSLIVEGVHLSVRVLMKVVETFPNVVPFLVYIKKEEFHKQRFAVRAKYMTTDPKENRYISNFYAIRLVQKQLSEGASEHLIPKIDNRNIDRSIETMHMTLFTYLKKLEGKPTMYDKESGKLTFLNTIWKRRKQKQQTSKAKILKAISQIQEEFEQSEQNPPPVASSPPISSSPPVPPFATLPTSSGDNMDDLFAILPSEKAVFKDEIGETDISFSPEGTMLIGSSKESESEVVEEVPAKEEKLVSPEPSHQHLVTFDLPDRDDNETTENDPVEITLTDFVETTDFNETTDTEQPDYHVKLD